MDYHPPTPEPPNQPVSGGRSAHWLVTGAGGFVGGRLIEHLRERGHRITALVHSHASGKRLEADGYSTRVGDVRDRGLMDEVTRGVDMVAHLASVVATTSMQRSREINVGGTMTLAAAAAAQQSPPKFLYVSSLAAAGPCPVDSPRTERAPCQPTSFYGKTKLEAEQALAAMADQLPITIIRPPGVFGPWDKNLLSLFQVVKRGWNPVAVSRAYQYSFVYVEDLVRALAVAANWGGRLIGPDNPDGTGLYFVADPEPYSFELLADTMGGLCGVQRLRHFTIPRQICWLVATGPELWMRVSGRKTYLNYDKIREAVAGSWVCDPSRAILELGARPEKCLPERLQETYDWYVSHGWL